MKQIFIIGLLLFYCSCSNNNNNRETEQLKERLSRLEQKIDSLLYGTSMSTGSIPFESNNNTKTKSISYKISLKTSRCQAITKKGTQCKRTAKSNGYCWQHGG